MTKGILLINECLLTRSRIHGIRGINYILWRMLIVLFIKILVRNISWNSGKLGLHVAFNLSSVSWVKNWLGDQAWMSCHEGSYFFLSFLSPFFASLSFFYFYMCITKHFVGHKNGKKPSKLACKFNSGSMYRAETSLWSIGGEVPSSLWFCISVTWIQRNIQVFDGKKPNWNEFLMHKTCNGSKRVC